MSAYYNEIDPYAAQWLRNLIDKGLIAPGVVDERSIEDVKPNELMGYTQCHFFAGIGVWSLALRRAGWPDNRPIWTGSCPCQPFSAAGAQAGFEDARHLWPSLAWLIKQCGPSVVAGEQVASKSVEPWIDLVHADLEALDYAFGCIAFPSAGVGSPHIRDRAYWVGNSNESGSQRLSRDGCTEGRKGSSGPVTEAGLSGRLADTAREQHDRPGISGETGRAEHTDGCADGGLANPDGSGREQGSEGRQAVGYGPAFESDSSLGGMANSNLHEHGQPKRERDSKEGSISGEYRQEITGPREFGRASDSICGMADAKLQQRQGSTTDSDEARGRDEESAALAGLCSESRPGPTNGFWGDADWLLCRDDKWRPVKSGSFPLADGVASRVGRLRAYGNAINAEAATVFIQSVMELLNSSASREFAA